MTERAYTALLVEETDDGIRVRLNRPDVRNAIDAVTTRELHRICDVAEEHPRILTIAGGSGFFAAGADIGQLRARRRDDGLRGVNARLFSRIQALPMPTIAVIDGYALGGGAELAYACDFRIGSTLTKLGNPETGLGIIAGAGATWRLIELVGEPLAKEILLTGRTLDAQEARAAGLLTRVVKSEQLDTAVEELRAAILKQAPLAVQLTKRVMHAPRAAHPFVDELAQAVLFETEEKEHRMTAFLERKRAAGTTQ